MAETCRCLVWSAASSPQILGSNTSAPASSPMGRVGQQEAPPRWTRLGFGECFVGSEGTADPAGSEEGETPVGG